MTIHHGQLPPQEIESYDRGWTTVADQLEGRISASA
jgi:hypothetical protein